MVWHWQASESVTAEVELEMDKGRGSAGDAPSRLTMIHDVGKLSDSSQEHPQRPKPPALILENVGGAGRAFHLVELVHLAFELVEPAVVDLDLSDDAQAVLSGEDHAHHDVAVSIILGCVTHSKLVLHPRHRQPHRGPFLQQPPRHLEHFFRAVAEHSCTNRIEDVGGQRELRFVAVLHASEGWGCVGQNLLAHPRLGLDWRTLHAHAAPELVLDRLPNAVLEPVVEHRRAPVELADVNLLVGDGSIERRKQSECRRRFLDVDLFPIVVGQADRCDAQVVLPQHFLRRCLRLRMRHSSIAFLSMRFELCWSRRRSRSRSRSLRPSHPPATSPQGKALADLVQRKVQRRHLEVHLEVQLQVRGPGLAARRCGRNEQRVQLARSAMRRGIQGAGDARRLHRRRGTAGLR
mmetsp:Transcript_37675/g.88696  ORF Transcript_37675/g.88696 Transcript_37675/m.88696 type:complete len:407 (-) Transcript_37675:33-1253(-)